jgi:low temperature requirement protein LtrA
VAGRAGLLEPPRLRTTETAEDRRATWLELFFDLVFVVAIAELGTFLSDDPEPRRFLEYVALFAPVWWAWAGFTYYANRFDTDDLLYRLLVLVGMFAIAAMATNVQEAFGEDARGFVLSYVAARCVLLVLYARAIRFVEPARALAQWYFTAFAIAVVVWLASLALDPPGRYWLWALAMAIELSAPVVGWRLIPRAPVDVRHIPERFGLLTIIVLGESVLAVVIGVSDTRWDAYSALAAGAGFAAAVAVWWLYFDFLDESTVSRGILRGLVFTYGHFPIVVGIASMGVGVKLAILASAGGRYDDTGWVFAMGVAVCMAGLALVQLATPPALFDAEVRFSLSTAALAALLALAGGRLEPLLVLLMLAIALLAQVTWELVAHERHRGEAGFR